MRGLNENLAAITRLQEAARTAARQIVADGSMIIVAETQKNFSGSHAAGRAHVGGDQPNIVTGNLRRSIRADPVTETSSGVFRTEIAPHMVYARRVELGFTGADSLGRVFKQRPYPFFTPGVNTAVPKIRERAARIAETLLNP